MARRECVCLDPAVCGPGGAGAPGSDCPAGMVQIPGGTFSMGSTDEAPVHQVTLSPYCMDRTEVTVGAYGQCVSSGSCPAAPVIRQTCNGSREDRLEHPANCVNWTMAHGYCRWRGGRLPTEAEWEFAARGADGRTYPWGNQAPSARLLNAFGSENDFRYPMYTGSDGWPFTAPVGSFPAGASPFGVLDMAGNVLEWTSDWHGGYASAAATNPSGPSTGSQRVARGGDWDSVHAAWVRASSRLGYGPAGRLSNIGFRCARGVAR